MLQSKPDFYVKNCLHSACYVPGTLLSALQIITQLLSIIPRRALSIFVLILTGEKTEVQKR